jgi:hypothetical protein
MPSGEWTDGAFPIGRARIVAARLDTYRPSSPTASTWLRASETRSPPTWCAALRSARAITCSIHSLPHGSRSPDRIHNTDGQPLAYVYSRGSEAEARRAKMLTKDEARRIGVKVTRLPEPLGKWVRVCGSDRQSVVARRRT